MADVAAIPYVKLDRAGGVAPYHQIMSQLRQQIESGQLPTDRRLPAITKLATRYGVSRATVVRAINELSRQGLIESRWGSGNYVTRPAVATTEIIICHETPGAGSRYEAFFRSCVEAFRDSMPGPRRRIVASYTDRHPFSAGEMLAVAEARRADSLVFYRPTEDMYPAVRAVAQRIATVTLFRQVPDSAAAAVLADPADAVRTFLQRRIEQGRRRFLFAAMDEFLAQDAGSPYRVMHDTFEQVLADHGCPHPTVVLKRRDPGRPLVDAQRCLAEQTDDDVTVVSHVAWPIIAGKATDVAAYTESADTVQQFIAAQSLMYVDIARVVEQAALLLTDRRAAANGRVVKVPAELLEARTVQTPKESP